ncbi:MAG: elongation factor 1-beta [Candidatus Aenigmatarchaeota archaeon]|nr:MAG: elongation factor 1-beta [Candidatus Aenigmarchaeota archaeon]
MGDVAISLKVVPDSPEVDLEKLKEEIGKKVKVDDIKEEPIGFGLKALKILVVVPDSGGGTDEIERSLEEIEGVSSVIVEGVTLI